MISYLDSLTAGWEGAIHVLAVLLGFLFALTLHEFSHAFVAVREGDPTPRMAGRLSLNPFRHLDMFGTLCLIIFGFGWAKPVPINTVNFKQHYKRSLFLVSIAGVVMNILVAFFACALYFVVLRFFNNPNNLASLFLLVFLHTLVIYNIVFFLFNLIPIYPLDGFNIVLSLSRYQSKYLRFNLQYGTIMLIIVLIFGSEYIIWLADKIFLGFTYVWRWI